MNLRYKSPNGETQSQSQTTTSLHGPSHGGSTSEMPRGRRVAGWMLVASLSPGPYQDTRKDGRMGTPMWCCWQVARWDSTERTVSKPSPQPPRPLPCMGPGVWITGRALPDAHTPPRPERLGQDQGWFPDVGLAWGPAIRRLLI